MRWPAAQFAATLFVIWHARHARRTDERSLPALLLYFLVGLALLPLWVRLARRIRRGDAWRAAMLLAAAGFVPAALLGPGDAFRLRVGVCRHRRDTRCRHRAAGRTAGAPGGRREPPPGAAAWRCNCSPVGMVSKLALAIAAGHAAAARRAQRGHRLDPRRGGALAGHAGGLPVLIKLLAVLALQRPY